MALDANPPPHPAATRFVVVTGAPGAGKSAVLAAVKRRMAGHVRVLPEPRELLFGHAPASEHHDVQRAAQLAVYRVAVALERATVARGGLAVGRGTLDALAWWPGDASSFFESLDTSPEVELARYTAVIHLESAGLADARLREIWSAHPRLHIVDAADVEARTESVLDIVRFELEQCPTRLIA